MLREVGEAGRDAGRDHLELAGAHDRHGGAARSVAGSRFAYLKGDLVLLELALVRWALEKLRGHGLRAGRSRRCSCASRRCTAPASCPTPSSRSTGCADDDAVPRRARREVRARLAARRRDPRRERLPAALRRLLALLPPRGGRRRAATRAGSSACTSSTRSRCSRSWSPRTRATSTSGCSRSRRRSCRRSRSPTAWSTSRSTTSAPRRPRSTTARRGCPARSATAS